MSRLIEIIQQLITISSPNPDDARRRRNLSILTLGMGAILILEIIYTASGLQGGDTQGNLLLIAGSAFMLFSLVGIYFLNRNRSGILSAYIFLFLLIFVISFSDTPAQLADGRSLFVFIIPIVTASFILPPYTTFVFAFASSVIISFLAVYSGRSPNSPAIFGYFFIGLISWLSSSSLEQALRELRVINADLDKIVVDRTRELAEALSRETVEAGRKEAILNSIADGVIVFNEQNLSILANPALGQLTDTTHESLIGMSLNEFSQSKELNPANQKKLADLIKNPEKTQSGIRLEWGRRSLSIGAAHVQDTTTNEDIGAVAVFRDVTREAELEKMKENFVAVVSHELRTPLNAIMGLTEMLKEGIYGEINPKQVSIAERVMANATRLLSMVGDLLDEAQINAGKLSIKPQVFKTSSLLENLHSTMDKIAADKGLTLSTTLDVEMPETIKGDPQRLQQILVNLVNNAVKFTEKGRVLVGIQRIGKNDWKMEVTDSGIGIPEKEIPYIFESFRQASNTEMTTRQHGGFGLGLAIVKQLVELMNGRIEVRSEKDRGTTFNIFLPLEMQ